ncbi:MAG: M3 family oligoendopeptidase [Phototrophicales bacterium]|nr:MAG: M3 family oligoendopeptidase [Phototrophicales bacterium]RMG77157.1 MAG: M3 family oligoendopeptidase [Chloroflexota bacterium]
MQLPEKIEDIKDWTWDDIQPYFEELESRELTEETLNQWMADWSNLGALLWENFARAQVATTQNTADEQAEAYLKNLYATVFPKMSEANNRLNKKLVESGLKPDNFDVPLKKMQADIELFREENIPLQVREQALGMEYAKITGAQTVQWDGEELTLEQLKKVFQDQDRTKREQAWRLMMTRWLQDREAINNLWTMFFDVRQEMAANAGFDNYRDFRWKQFKRFDYTPQDCETFHRAIEQVVVPAAERANERRRQRLGIDSVRPWDINVDTSGKPALRPWQTIDEFAEKAETIFTHVDPELGGYYGKMRAGGYMDLPNRKNKGPGAYCTTYPHTGTPFVFMNAVGKRDDVRTLLHEVGHAFHGFEVMNNLPYMQQRNYPIEFAEVASMAMELLASPYLTQEFGGYYTAEEAARDRIEHLENIIFFWPYMAVVDGFQLWAYTSGDAAKDPAACDEKWGELWDRFMRLDYSGLDDEKKTGWHRKQHIFRYPFYYVEYGLAQLGAVQVWANALKDQQQAVKQYRQALALGGTRSIPQLYQAAGVKFAFDAQTLGQAVELIENTIQDLHDQL